MKMEVDGDDDGDGDGEAPDDDVWTEESLNHQKKEPLRGTLRKRIL
jgi:hypothetical protein